MNNAQQTSGGLKAGVAIPTTERSTINVSSPAIELLIGAPYTQNGLPHTYGHMALRVITSSVERVYDFGRYGKIAGEYSAEGEGILRIWESFNSYISNENSYGRSTKGFVYEVNEDSARKIINYYLRVIVDAVERRAKHPHMKEFKIPRNYHGITNNCVTMSLSGAKIALPKIDENAARYNQGRGMSAKEKTAAMVTNFGWPNHIFMPLDVQAMLESEKRYPVEKVVQYGK
jgi:hypothetical protein